jgi:ELWxxDGT repeat protein
MEVGNTVFFIANDGVHGRELWTTTGTGATIVADLNPNADDGAVRTLAEYDGDLLFIGNDGTHGAELWRSDGSAGGTHMIKDICSEPCDFFNPSWVIYHGLFYFTIDDGILGTELWVSDGTLAGTTIVRDINPGPDGSNPFTLTIVDDLIYFNANDGAHGAELWQSDGTAAGTVLAADLYPGPDWSSSFPFQLTVFGSSLLFQAYHPDYGNELYAFQAPTGYYTTTVSSDGAYDFPGTAADVVIEGYAPLSRQHRPDDGNTLIMGLYEQGPANIEGLSAAQLYPYRWVMHKREDYWIFANTTELRLGLSEIPALNVADPSGLTVYYRAVPGGGTFSPLTTSYDSSSGEIVATGFAAGGEFVLADADGFSIFIPFIQNGHPLQ